MLKGLLIAASATLFAIAPFAAQAEGQAFLSASGGPSSAHVKGITGSLKDYADYYGPGSSNHIDKKDSVYGITAGYRWMTGETFSIGLEGGYVDLGKITGTVDSGDPYYYAEHDRGSIRTRGGIAGINAKWDLSYHWNLGIRGGYLHTSTRTKESFEYTYFPPYSGHFEGGGKNHSSNDGFYGAARIGYDFTPFFGMGVGYEYYHTDYDGYFGKSKQNVGVVAASVEIRF